MTSLRHEDPPRDLTQVPSKRWPPKPHKHVTAEDQARRRRELKQEADERGKAIRGAEWIARFGFPCPY